MKIKISPSLTILMVVFVVFAPAMTFDFCSLDDAGHLQENPNVQNFDVKTIWGEPYFGMYIPVTYTVWAATRAVTSHPAAFHALNVIFHVANALLFLCIFTRWGFRPWTAVSGALFFAIHPAQVESVAWISSFRDVLSSFWGLLFVYFVFRRQLCWRSIVLPTLFLALSILSKPSGVVFAAVPFLYWFWQAHRLTTVQTVATCSWAVLAVAFSILAKTIQPAQTLILNPTISQKIAIAAKSLTFYAWKILDADGLSPDYGLAASRLTAEWQISGLPVLQIFAVAAMLLILGIFFWKKSQMAFGLVLAILFVSPYLGVIPFNFQNVSIVADRYMYLAIAGIGFSLAAIEPQTQNRIAYAVNFVIWGVIIFFTMKQLMIWRNNQALYSEMLARNPNSYMALNGLGVVELGNGQYFQAVQYFQKAVEINPGYYFARHNLAKTLELSGDPGKSLNEYVQTINSQPGFVPAYHGLAALLYNQGRFQEAAETTDRGLALEPNNAGLLSVRDQIKKRLSERR